MDKTTFERELSIRTARGYSKRTRWAPEDVRDALPEYLAGRGGAHVTHPIARALLDEQADLPRVVELMDPRFGERATNSPMEAFVRGFNSSDFAIALQDSTQALVKTAYDLRATAQQLLRRLVVRDFKETKFPVLEVSDGIGDPVPEGGVLGQDNTITLTMDSALEPGGLESRTVILRFSRQLMAHDETAALLMQAEGIAKSVRRSEAKELARVLELTDHLSDAAAFFNTSTGNLVDTGSGAPPSVSTLNTATEKVWDLAEAPPRYIVVPPQLAITAQVLAASVSVPGQSNPLEVVVLKHLTSATAWYLLPDPEASPAIGQMTLAPSGDVFNVSRALRIPNSDDVGVRISADFRVVRLARVGFKNAGVYVALLRLCLLANADALSVAETLGLIDAWTGLGLVEA